MTRNVLTRVRLLHPNGTLHLVQVVSSSDALDDATLTLETVENGMVTLIGQFEGKGMEALMRSGRLMRIVLQMVYGMDAAAEQLAPDADDEVTIIPGTPTLEA